MTAVADSEKPLLIFPEPELAAQAVNLLGIGGEFLQTRQGELQVRFDICASAAGARFNVYNRSEQFIEIKTARALARATAEFGFFYEHGGEVECELLTGGQELGRGLLQTLVLADGQPVLEAAEEVSLHSFDELCKLPAEPENISQLARVAVEAADALGDQTAEMLAIGWTVPEEGDSFLRPQRETVPLLGRLSCLAAEAVREAQGRQVQATVCLDCDPGRVRQIIEPGFDKAVNLVRILVDEGQGVKTLFRLEAEPETDDLPGLARIMAFVETTHQPDYGRVTRLVQRGGELRRITAANDELESDEAVDSWQSAVEIMARQAVAAAKGEA